MKFTTRCIAGCFFISLNAYGAGYTINYVWVPADRVTLPATNFVTSSGNNTGRVTFYGSQGTAGFHHRIYDCNVSDWTGKWNKETYTYLSVPRSFATPIGDIKIATTYSGSSYQWYEDGRDVSYWKAASATDVSLGAGSCAAFGSLGVMDYMLGNAVITMTVPTLPWAGEINVNIPIYSANMEHWWNVTHGGNANWEYGYAQFKHLLDVPWFIPVNIKAYTNCRLNANNMTINHGVVSLQQALAEGVSATGSVGVSCTLPTNLRLSVMSATGDGSNTVRCGANGGTCTLTVNGGKDTVMNNVTNGSISVKSLFKANNNDSGSFTGNAILRVDVM